MWWLTGTRGLLRGRGGVLVPFVGYVKMYFFMHQFTSRPFFIGGGVANGCVVVRVLGLFVGAFGQKKLNNGEVAFLRSPH